MVCLFVLFCFCDKMLKNQRWLKHIMQKMKRQPVYTCGHQVTWQQSRSWLEATGRGDFYLIWNQTKRHGWPPLPSSLYLPPPSGVFITKGDVGVGTIVGSAVFNILVIIGLSGIFAGQVWKKKKKSASHLQLLLRLNNYTCNLSFQTVELTWWSLFRDSSYYILSVLTLIMVRWAFHQKLSITVKVFLVHIVVLFSF